MGRLKGKIALVTGGGSGIGRATAVRFVKEGATVFIVGRRLEELQSTAAAGGPGIIPILADVVDDADRRRIADAIQAQGGLDIVVSNAGIATSESLETVSEEAFDRTFGVNVRGLVFLMQICLPMLRCGGSVVLIGSIVAFKGVPGYTAYGATKASVRSFARTWTNEFKGRGVRVNTISPGPIDTPMLSAYGTDEEVAALRESLIGQIPFGRLGKPEEVASAALFLASDESSFIGGADLVVDGGMTAL